MSTQEALPLVLRFVNQETGNRIRAYREGINWITYNDHNGAFDRHRFADAVSLAAALGAKGYVGLACGLEKPAH